LQQHLANTPKRSGGQAGKCKQRKGESSAVLAWVNLVGDRVPDLRDSWVVEQDADANNFLYRDDYYTKDACKEPGVVETIVAKQRIGPTGTVRLAWQGSYVRFDNL
jgi:hypothetical protein